MPEETVPAPKAEASKSNPIKEFYDALAVSKQAAAAVVAKYPQLKATFSEGLYS